MLHHKTRHEADHCIAYPNKCAVIENLTPIGKPALQWTEIEKEKTAQGRCSKLDLDLFTQVLVQKHDG